MEIYKKVKEILKQGGYDYMLEIITNIQKVPHLKYRFTTAALNIDGYRTDSPIIAKKDDKYYIVSRHLDRGNMEELKKLNLLPHNAEPVYFKPYFAFVPIEPLAKEDFYAVFEYIAQGYKVIRVQQDMPMYLYEMFSAKYELLLEEQANIPLMYLYKVPRKAVVERFAETREEAIRVAKNLVVNSRDKEEIEAYLDNTADERFETLDKMMAEEGIEYVFFTSPLGVQEVTGFGMNNFVDDEVAAIYKAGSDEVFFLSAKIQMGFGREEIIFDVNDFVQKTINDCVVGIEEQHFSFGWFNYFRLNNMKWKKAQALTRNFRLLRGVYNLPYYIITSRAGTYAIDNAISWAKEQILAGATITELDVSDKHDALVKEFSKINKIPFKVGKYWTGLHASDRSVTPSFPFNHKITTDSKALKIDAGLILKDKNGILLAVSDIARTITFADYGDKLYEVIEKIMFKDMIPKIKDGITGGEIYKMATDLIEEYRPALEPIGMIPKENVGDVFRRDVGHGLSLHEPGTLWFEKGAKMIVREGMVCAHEIQWSTRGFSIGIEDNFLVGKTHGINLCRD